MTHFLRELRKPLTSSPIFFIHLATNGTIVEAPLLKGLEALSEDTARTTVPGEKTHIGWRGGEKKSKSLNEANLVNMPASVSVQV